MKLLALLTHSSKESTHGVDFARVVQPMSHLKGKYKDLKVTIKVSPFTKKLTSWDEVTKYYDAIYFSYTTNDIGFVNMAFFARKNGCRLIIDCDDNLWEIPRGSEAYKVFNPDSVLLATATDIMRECDYLTTTNRYLANRMAKVLYKDRSNIKIFPNYIDFDLYNKEKCPPRVSKTFNIYFHGTNTHVVDLIEDGFLNGLKRIMAKYPQVHFHTVGMNMLDFVEYFGERYHSTMGKKNVFEWAKELWPKVISEADMVVAPLVQSNFSKSKSDIKFKENSAGARAGVYERIRQYEDVGALTADTEDEWFNQMSRLIEDEAFRMSEEQRVWEIAKQNQAKDHIEEYRDFFMKIGPKQKTEN